MDSLSSYSQESLQKGGKVDVHVVEERYADKSKFNGRFGLFWRVSYWIDSFGEARGIDRQPPSKRGKGDLRQYARLALIWLGAAGSLSSMTGFFIGPLLFDLSFRDSMSAGISGAFFGTLFAAYGALTGPKSGLRQMVSTRFQFGWYPSKFVALLNVLTLLGWSVISLVFGGQLLKALNDNIPLEIGILIIAIVSLIVAVFGIQYVTLFDKVFVGPALVVFLLVYVCTGSEYATGSESVGSSKQIIANWLSFFGSCVGITSTWVALASDYFVDFPEDSNPWVIYIFVVIFMFIPTIFIGCAGIGIASAARFTNEKWAASYENLGTGGLLAESLSKWKGGGKFMVVVMFLSLVTNNILNTYSIPLSAQAFGRIWTKTPRYVLTIVTAIVYFVLASAGRTRLHDILSNFLPMIAYWSMIYCTILILEMGVFRYKKSNEHQWEFWNTKEHFPWMWAAIIAFCAGIAGCVLGMSQAYYIGVIGKLIGDTGGDLGVFLATGFTFVVYIPLRCIEISIRRQRPIRP